MEDSQKGMILGKTLLRVLPALASLLFILVLFIVIRLSSGVACALQGLSLEFNSLPVMLMRLHSA